MPIQVDHDERREKIVNAAVRVLGERGFANFSLRAVSDRLGGSVTLVTHYFPNREALLVRMLEQTLDDARSTQEELAAIEDPHDRLEAAVRYFLPTDDEALAIERARVALASHRDVEPFIQQYLDLIEPVMRELIRTAVQDFIGRHRLDATVDLIRVWTSGVVLSTVEHPELWTPEHQIEALHHFMNLIDLPVAAL
ncbi:TetR/AcrR family transcriptional regulator [Planomonospora sp. ID82291]|uniref:TetR/AcrR family transcriptional regulator n=1 Tax=Planomonospora sp. ID82291 TaxID=2738136 RepID=UPI0018C3767B|nr:TetR/AcrR family transcriptional regulator [Planomonospora sp. ID82291]MBG0817806.1 TetR/AcrR family transcriptional regulator [Planomonospora sp. ID82291]